MIKEDENKYAQMGKCDKKKIINKKKFREILTDDHK